ncbi:hypothetical protein [Vibrio aestuarianus]|uniref:Uncharacterized protein n=1 Tax=Vibrio aestuarianus TaxID=28171 RepID=A0A9X4EZE6_9VIBR|nr:hypothetical protein [Vibrio aestuarianus]MDE1244217.1 hypothetical protein [Vibrio aestuarianus]
MSFFVLSGFAIAGLLILWTLYIDDLEQFNETLTTLGLFGGFLSGVGTIIAAGAAALGVDSWIKQFKSGKYLVLVWDAQVALRKVHAAETFWYIHAYRRSDDAKDLLKSKSEELNVALDELDNSAHSLDALVNKNAQTLNDVLLIRYVIKRIREYLQNSSMPSTAEEVLHDNEQLVPLNKEFDDAYKQTKDRLDAIENQYSK